MSDNQSRPLLDARDVEVHFPIVQGFPRRTAGLVRAVDGVSFEIAKRETLGLVGESGSGKSTTARAVLQLVRPTKGSVLIDGVDVTLLRGSALREMRREFQMVFQDPYSSLDPRQRVGDIVSEPLIVHRLLRGDALRRRTRELLSLTGLREGFAERYPHELSGGERQRVGIARALALGPKLVVADEPISSLDVSIQAQIVNLLDDLRAELGLAYLFISHDLGVVRHFSDRVAVMYLGKLVEVASARSIFESPLHPYTRLLLAAGALHEDVHVADLPATSRETPSPSNLPSGCRFRTRCPLASELCAEVEPQLEEKAPAHAVACHYAQAVDLPEALGANVPRRGAH